MLNAIQAVGRNHLLTLADLNAAEINRIIAHSFLLKATCRPWTMPFKKDTGYKRHNYRLPSQSLFNKSVALLFSKRSTRTRVAAETSASLLGGTSLFLGRDDIQLGVNENMRDTAMVIGGMCQGFFARVGHHDEIIELAQYSPVPVINALSSLYHPTQVLADLLTLHEYAHLFNRSLKPVNYVERKPPPLPSLPSLTVAYVGDSTNVLHDMLFAYPILGHKLRVATPSQYRAPEEVWNRLKLAKLDKQIWWGEDPKLAVKGADVVVTDTWISMGQEAEKEERLLAFKGYQVTEKLCEEANPNWVFLHCLPRKPDEVDDDVFYGKRSLVFPEAENRKWSIMALFDLVFGKWELRLPSEDGNTHAQELILPDISLEADPMAEGDALVETKDSSEANAASTPDIEEKQNIEEHASIEETASKA